MPDDVVQPHIEGVNKALAEGWHVLERGGRALDAVQAAITYMEDDDTFDAGRGSFLTRDGRVQLDALMMDGATLRAGGVGQGHVARRAALGSPASPPLTGCCGHGS